MGEVEVLCKDASMAPPYIKPKIYKVIPDGKLRWVRPTDQLPDDALIGGNENESLYIIKAPVRGSVASGKFVPSLGLGYIAWGGQACEISDFEVLCGYDCFWVPTIDNKIPVGAVACGYAEITNERLYVGRTTLEGYTIPGKVHPSHSTCYIPYNGREIGNSNYEILVDPNVDNQCVNCLFVRNAPYEYKVESETENRNPRDYLDDDDELGSEDY